MCGQFVLDRTTTELASLFDVDRLFEVDTLWDTDRQGEGLPERPAPFVPTQAISIILDSLPRATDDDPYPEPLRRMEAARWGLVPGSSKDPNAKPTLATARSEGITSQPSFQAAVIKRRAVVPASGYVEWKSVAGGRVPYLVSLPGEELLVFAALFEWWRNPAASEGAADRWLLSSAILTRPSSGPVAGLSERMPLLLDADLVEGWLDPGEEGTQEFVDELVAAAHPVAERIRLVELGEETVVRD